LRWSVADSVTEHARLPSKIEALTEQTEALRAQFAATNGNGNAIGNVNANANAPAAALPHDFLPSEMAVFTSLLVVATVYLAPLALNVLRPSLTGATADKQAAIEKEEADAEAAASTRATHIAVGCLTFALVAANILIAAATRKLLNNVRNNDDDNETTTTNDVRNDDDDDDDGNDGNHNYDDDDDQQNAYGAYGGQ
jgi:hypothetical protein